MSSVILTIFLLISVVSMTSVSARDWKEGDNGQVRWDSYCRYVGDYFSYKHSSDIANMDKSASPTIDARTLHMGMEPVTCIPVDMERGSEITGHLGGFVVTFPLVPLFLIK